MSRMIPVRHDRKWSRCAAAAMLVTLIAPLSGCTGLYILFGPNGLFPPGGGGPLDGITTPDPNTGGTGGPGNTVPSTSPPAPVAGPNYRISRLDNLLEATAGGKMIIASDFDFDGRTDFASIASESQVVQLYLRNPATNLFDQTTIAGGAPLTRMIRIGAADFDGDGHTDLAVAVNDTGFLPMQNASKDGAIVVLFSPPDPRNQQLEWLPVTIVRRPNDAASISDMVIADFDGVNGPDIAFLSNEPASGGSQAPLRFVFMYLNPGPANARTPGAWGVPRATLSPGGQYPPFVELDAPEANQLFAADVDGDGDPDLIMTLSQAHSFNIRWLENPGGPNIDPNPAQPMPRWNRRFVGQQDLGANVAAVGDIDGNGTPDVAAATNDGGLVQWFRHPGFGAVSIQNFPWQVYNIGLLTASPVTQVHIVDLNDDGRADVWTGAGGVMRGFFPRSGSNFLDWWTPFSIASTDPVAIIGWPAFLDIDGNGRMDFVVPLDREGLSNDQFAIFAR